MQSEKTVKRKKQKKRKKERIKPFKAERTFKLAHQLQI